MSCEICGAQAVFILNAGTIKGIDPNGPNVDICGNCFIRTDRDALIQKARNPALVPPPINTPAPVCCSCGGTSNMFGFTTYLSSTDGFNYDICGMCTWHRNVTIEANLQANIAKGIIKSRAPQKPPALGLKSYFFVGPQVSLPKTWTTKYYGFFGDDRANDNSKPIGKTVAENGLEGMYCRICNVFCSWVEPNRGSDYVCPGCR